MFANVLPSDMMTYKGYILELPSEQLIGDMITAQSRDYGPIDVDRVGLTLIDDILDDEVITEWTSHVANNIPIALRSASFTFDWVDRLEPNPSDFIFFEYLLSNPGLKKIEVFINDEYGSEHKITILNVYDLNLNRQEVMHNEISYINLYYTFRALPNIISDKRISAGG